MPSSSMTKDDMMRVCRAMASIRPSLIALIMNLTREDLIFMEKCFQRTLLVRGVALVVTAN